MVLHSKARVVDKEQTVVVAPLDAPPHVVHLVQDAVVVVVVHVVLPAPQQLIRVEDVRQRVLDHV